MIRALPDFPVTIVDFPAQSTDSLLGAFQHFRLLESFEASGVRPTLLIFAADDSTAAESASASARFFLDKADYLPIENPAKFQSSEFKKTALFKWLSERKTPTIRLPAVTEVTINEWKALERRSKKYIQLEEAVKHPDLFYTVRDELTYFRDAFLAQFRTTRSRASYPTRASLKTRLSGERLSRRWLPLLPWKIHGSKPLRQRC
jgi:hypothetical protein